MREPIQNKVNPDLQLKQEVGKNIQQLLKAGLFGLAFFSTGLMALPQSGQELAAMTAPGISSAPPQSEFNKSRDEQLLEQIQAAMRENMNTIKFIRNDGQWSQEILYKGISRTGQVNVTASGLRFVTPQRSGEGEQAQSGFHAWSISFRNSPGIKGVVASDQAKVKTSYHSGAGSVSAVPASHELLLQQVYPGIDLRLYSREQGKLEFDWMIAAGVDYRQIQLQIDGVDGLDLSNPDQLAIALHMSSVDMHIPESYQVDKEGKIIVQARYEQLGDNLLAYHVEGKINPDLPLVIDPELNWGTWFDGSHTPYSAQSNSGFDNYLNAIDIAPCSDQDGNSYQRCVYAAGTSNIDVDIGENGYISYPFSKSLTPFQESFSGGSTDAVVYVLDENGQNVLYATHFGGTDWDKGYGLAVSPAGGTVFLSGSTESSIPITDGTSPGTHAAFESVKPSSGSSSKDGYVAAFDITLQTLKYSTYLGTTAAGDSGGFEVSENITSIRAISDDTYVVGGTMGAALASKYISANASDSTYNGGSGIDAYAQYIAKFSGFNNLDFGTYVDGGQFDQNNDTIVLKNGDIAFVGVTQCTGGTCGDEGFPALVNDAGAEATNCASIDNQAVVGVINPNRAVGQGFEMLSRMGGCSDDAFFGIIELANGNLYVAGTTDSGDFPLGTGTPFQGTKQGGSDGIVGYLPPTGGAGNWSASFLGGDGDDIINTVEGFFDGVFLYGTTAFTNADPFPTLNVGGGSFFSATHGGGPNGGLDIFFTALSLNLENMVFSTLVGGSMNDYLGDTGEPRGSNHIYADDSYLWLGTTVHSATFTHPLISSIANGFDTDSFDVNKSNPTSTSADSHIIFRIGRVATNIKLAKAVTNNASGTSLPGDFTLTVQGNDGTNDTPMNYVDQDVVVIQPDLLYTINETGEATVGAGYTKTGIACLNDADSTPIGSTQGDGSYQLTATTGDNITCTVSNQDNSTPAITIVKTGSGPLTANGQGVDYSAIGDVLNYTYLVTNTGNVNLQGPVIIDDDVTTDESCLPLDPANANNGDTVFDAGEAIYCYSTHSVTQQNIDDGSVHNTATATAGGVTSNPDDETLNAGLLPAIQLQKTGIVDLGADAVASVGDIITYDFTVTNTGNVTLNPVTVTDADPDITVVGGPISLAPGTSDSTTFTATYALKQIDVDNGYFFNTATTSGGCTAAACPVTDDDDDEQLFEQVPAIDIDKTGSFAAGANNVADVGEVISYTLTVTNTGNVTLSPVTVTDTIIADAGISCAGGSNVIASMLPQAVVVCTATYAVTQPDIEAGTRHNVGTATGQCPILEPANSCAVDDSDPHDQPLAQGPGIVIIKAGAVNGGADGVGPGDAIDYTFDVSNSGNIGLTNVTVTDPLVTTITCPAPGNGNLSLAVGASVQCTGSYTLLETDIIAGNRQNTATATGQCTAQGQCPTDDTDDHDEPLPHIDLAKTAGAATLMPNGSYNVVYTVVASNTGQAAGIYSIIDTFAPATGLTLSTSPGIAYVSGEVQSGSIGTFPNLVTGEGLAAGASESWTITANFTVDPTANLTDARGCVPGAATTGKGFFNHVEGSASDTVPGNNDACSNLPEPAMDLAKTINKVEFTGVNEQTVTYIITATNSGDGPAVYNVVDNLQPGTGITPSSIGPGMVTYVAIDDNFASPVTDPPGWPVISSNETISGQSSESWQVVIVFALDPTNAGFDATRDCATDASGWIEGRGFYNEVEAIAGEVNLTNNKVCASPSLAYLSIVKVIENNANGDLTEADFPITVTGTDGVHDSGTDYLNGDNPDVVVGTTYTITEDAVNDDYELKSIECTDDANASALGDSFTLTENQSVTCTVTNVHQELLINSLAAACINGVPYVSYNVSTTGVEPPPTEVEVRFYSDGGNGSVNPADYTTLVETRPARALAGQELWPGATVDLNGDGLTWPGWQEQPNGTWIAINDGLLPSLLMVFEANPMSEQIVNYPPPNASCEPLRIPPEDTVPVPVNYPWALILMILSMLGMGWYYRPTRER